MNDTAAPRATLHFSHIGFYVRDLPLMEDFYSRIVGLAVTDRGLLGTVGLVFLSGDPQEHHQLVLASGRPPQALFNPINQISFRVADVASLRNFYRSLRGEAVTEVLPATHGNAVSVYFRDPEGNRLEVFVDTPWYCEQPLREPIDLEQSDEQIMAAAERIARATPGFVMREQWVEKMRQLMQAAGRA